MMHRVTCRARLPLIISALIITSAASAQPKVGVDSLYGRWELKGRWKSDAVSSIIELLPGGWYSQALVNTNHLYYDYNGAMLVLMSVSPSGTPDTTTRAVLDVRFDGDTLTATNSRDTIRMVRSRGGEFLGDIKGRWMMITKEKENPVAQEFTPTGELRVFTTISGEVGRYRVLGNEIEWQPMLPQRFVRRTKFKLLKDKLKLWAGNDSDELSRIR